MPSTSSTVVLDTYVVSYLAQAQHHCSLRTRAYFHYSTYERAKSHPQTGLLNPVSRAADSTSVLSGTAVLYIFRFQETRKRSVTDKPMCTSKTELRLPRDVEQNEDCVER